MNYTLMITVALTLASSFNIEMVSATTGQVGQMQVDDVMFQSQSTKDNGSGDGNSCQYQGQGLIGPDGGCVYVKNDQGEDVAFVTLEPGFLKEQVLVAMEKIPDSPPGGYDYLRFYEDEVVTPIGQRVAITFPYSAIDLESAAELVFFALPYEGTYDSGNRNLYEAQIALGGDQVFFTRRQYSIQATPDGATGSFISTPGNLYSFPPFSDNPPEVYQLVVQPLSTTRPQ
ncbi:MAG: hypothetical protein AAF708_20135 [Deinococcota bacterium]